LRIFFKKKERGRKGLFVIFFLKNKILIYLSFAVSKKNKPFLPPPSLQISKAMMQQNERKLEGGIATWIGIVENAPNAGEVEAALRWHLTAKSWDVVPWSTKVEIQKYVKAALGDTGKGSVCLAIAAKIPLLDRISTNSSECFFWVVRILDFF